MTRSRGKFVIAGIVAGASIIAFVAVYAARDRQISRVSKVATFASKTIAATLEADRILNADIKNMIAPLRENAWLAFADVQGKALAEQAIFERASLNLTTREYLSSASDAFARISERDALLRNLASSRYLMSAAKRDLESVSTGSVYEHASSLLHATQNDEARELRDIAAATAKLRSALTTLDVKGDELTRELGNIEFPRDELRAAIDRYSESPNN